MFREPGSAKDLPDLPDFADTQEGSAYVVDDDQTEGQYDLYIHSAKGRAWTIVNNWGGVPGPRGVKGDTGAVPVLESGTTDTGESGSPAEFRVEDMGLNKHGRPVHRIHAVLPQGIPGVRKGNVEVASEGLVAGRAYNFIPDNDDVPIGHFEEARTYWDGISGKPEITTRTYIDGADTALGERITAETVRATASETALDERIDSAKTSAETYTDRKLTGYLTEQETYSAIEERVRGELNDMGSVPTRADLPAVADDFDLYRIIDEDIDVYARNVESALAWKTLNFTIDMSRYETTAGAREKAQAALNSANAHTDEVGGELGGRVSALESGGMSVVVQAYGPVVQKALVFNVEKGGIFRGADVSVPVKVSSPSFSLISGIVSGIALSPDGLYLVVTGTYNPTFAFYKRSGSTYIKQPNPASLPGGGYNGCTFSPDGLYLAVAHDRSPCITICKREGDTLTKLPAPATLPTGSGRGVAFSPDGAYLAVALGGGSPFIAIYKREGDTFTKLDDPAVLPEGAGSGLGAAFSPDSALHIAVPYHLQARGRHVHKAGRPRHTSTGSKQRSGILS